MHLEVHVKIQLHFKNSYPENGPLCINIIELFKLNNNNLQDDLQESLQDDNNYFLFIFSIVPIFSFFNPNPLLKKEIHYQYSLIR